MHGYHLDLIVIFKQEQNMMVSRANLTRINLKEGFDYTQQRILQKQRVM
jgi:hypothetical protein